ncbi:uncharacterized protein COLE_06160 [Cutaneotrichosporon oleaginosum]|uniref:uncharacterized protein n=1 Tax=Cutaneotrichosporon oleaginosum TaxID=879819 RepID=UPI00132470D1|nr:hypothetical protein COLE_06160 [Cutaneotrichosporon oleaginosum]
MSEHASPNAESKPKPDDNTLNIKIRATDSSEVFFKIKKTTKLNKLKTAYADRVGQDPAAIRLLFDGTRILDNQTAEDLEMEDGDVLEVLLERELPRFVPLTCQKLVAASLAPPTPSYHSPYLVLFIRHRALPPQGQRLLSPVVYFSM